MTSSGELQCCDEEIHVVILLVLGGRECGVLQLCPVATYIFGHNPDSGCHFMFGRPNIELVGVAGVRSTPLSCYRYRTCLA